MSESLYKDFIEAVRQDAEEHRGIIAELKFANKKMHEFLCVQEKNFIIIEKRSERIDALFNKLCASNDK